MSRAKELGKIGEQLAVDHMEKNGFRVLKRNYMFPPGEVDIIAQKDEFIIFVEVKTRESAYLSDPALLVSRGKQKQIIRVADNYIKGYYPEKPYRFDIIIVITNSQYTKIEHIEDAFYPMI